MVRKFCILAVAVTLSACSPLVYAQDSPAAEATSPVERLAPESDPAVRAAVELPRTEPRHYLWAIVSLTDLGQSELAVPILKDLQQQNLNGDQRADLVEEFGSHRMLKLARDEALSPDGGTLANACMAAAAARAGLPPTNETFEPPTPPRDRSVLGRAVVLMPRAEHATTLAGRLIGLGIEADPAVRGGSAMRLAQQSADLEFLLVDFDIHAPGIRDMLYALRTDPATARIPIGLLATSERLEAAKRLAAEHHRVIAFPRPQSDQWTAHIIEELSNLSAGDGMSPEARAEIGRQARARAESDRPRGATP